MFSAETENEEGERHELTILNQIGNGNENENTIRRML